MGWFTRKKKEEKEDDGVIRICLTGDEELDNERAFAQMGITSKQKQEEILKEYTWHYLDDLNEDLVCTMQLVQTEALEAAKPFSDSRDIMEKMIGITYIRKGDDDDTSDLNEIDFSDIRVESMATCLSAGFTPTKSLPWIKEVEVRSAEEIAGRLHAIKMLVLWLMVPSVNLPDDAILKFVNENGLNDFLTPTEKDILVSSRTDANLRNSIGWKFENAWPLAWYFGYQEPAHSGQMMTGEQMQEILSNHTCGLDDSIENWLKNQKVVEENELLKKEDLFYCLHNAVRSAQMGGNTVPEGFDPIGNGGVIHERRHSLTWMISNGVDWDDTDLST